VLAVLVAGVSRAGAGHRTVSVEPRGEAHVDFAVPFTEFREPEGQDTGDFLVHHLGAVGRRFAASRQGQATAAERVTFDLHGPGGWLAGCGSHFESPVYNRLRVVIGA
jgi:hypothetical protein